MATAAKSLSLAEQIAEEELLIRIYIADIAKLKQQGSRQAELTAVDAADAANVEDNALKCSTSDDHDLLLDWMHYSDESSRLANVTESLNPAPLVRMNRMQACLSGFCLESVDRHSPSSDIHSNQDSPNRSSQREAYTLKGYFVDHQELGATIRIELQIEAAVAPNHLSVRSSTIANEDKSANERQLRVSAVLYTLVSRAKSHTFEQNAATDDDIAWLQQLDATVTFDPLNLASWTDAMVRYLRFRKQRLLFLREKDHAIRITRQVHAKMTIELLLSDRQDSFTVDSSTSASSIHLDWDWSWKLGKDLLRLPETTMMSLSLHRSGLAQLVTLTGSCQAAIELMLPSSTTTSSSSESDSNNSNEDSDADDEAAVSRHDELAFNADGDDGDEEYDDDASDISRIEKAKHHSKKHKLSEYELQRLERIKRNEAYFVSLGLQAAKDDLRDESNGKRRKKK
ncbi:hypothetical protein MPSEU_000934300 [Mayamaea pseudoterrestris]|nr:hypothetical protein MPSEU_000934300 [Mayamaea pseudoterrestris]